MKRAIFFGATAGTLVALLAGTAQLTSNAQPTVPSAQEPWRSEESITTPRRVAATLDTVLIASDDGMFITDQNKTISLSQQVELYAVGRARTVQGDTLYYASTHRLVVDGQIISPRQIVPWPAQATFSWFKVEPEPRRYSNVGRNGVWSHWAAIVYKDTPIGAGPHLATDVSPTLHAPVAYHGVSVGTMRFALRISYDGTLFSTPNHTTRDRIGIRDSVHRISRRGETGSPVLDSAFALANTPYVLGSNSPTGSVQDHQTTRMIGADCADLCVGALVLSGWQLPYSSAKGLRHVLLPIISQIQYNGEDCVSNHEDVLAVRVQRGDILVTDRHAAVYVGEADSSDHSGILTSKSLCYHTRGTVPEITTLRKAFPRGGFSVIRPAHSEQYAQNTHR
jgi:cell wall-associated NlpC family hydrolase